MSAAPERSASPGRVAVAMSGGVDSSVAAALLVEQGFDVVGVHMKLHEGPAEERRNKRCCSLDDSLDARQVCAALGIPFYVIDFTEVFRREVIDYFVGAYRVGRTPNPCVMCNVHLKSAALLGKVREFGCDRLATGHYARIRRNPETGEPEIVKPRDHRKDQTYFLFGTPRAELPALLFPLADYVKEEARALAGRRDLITWDKPDSQEICFVPRDYRHFLRQRLEAQPEGDFVDRQGNLLGRHGGVAYYTIGQRRGLGIAGPEPRYVVGLDAAANRVVLGDERELYATRLWVREANWVSCAPPSAPIEALVKIRSTDPGTPAEVIPREGGTAEVRFTRPVRAVTPGQAAVFYSGDVLLGGGWIEVGEG